MTYRERRQREAATKVCGVMASKGFDSVFEFTKPVMDGRMVWVLWVNFSTGQQVMTHIDSLGNVSYDGLHSLIGFARDWVEDAETVPHE